LKQAACKMLVKLTMPGEMRTVRDGQELDGDAVERALVQREEEVAV